MAKRISKSKNYNLGKGNLDIIKLDNNESGDSDDSLYVDKSCPCNLSD